MTKEKTKYPGVRCRLHSTRKHGVNADRYFFIRYRLDGKSKEEGLGWASEGMTAKKASFYLGKLKEAKVTGSGARTLSEQREQERIRREQDEKESLNFGRFFQETYFPLAKSNKTYKSYNRERFLFELWINPVIGDKPLSKISPLDLERIKKNMSDAGRAPRTIHYCLAVIRQVFNLAITLDIRGDNPVSKVKKPSVDNRRVRFLSREEADTLLQDLGATNPQLHDMSLLALHCGLRAGEIFNLTWECIDLERETIFLKDTKSGRNRTAYMTDQVKIMLRSKQKQRETQEHVFKARCGGKIERVSNVFWQTIKRLGYNKGVTDPRNKVVFHTLRHTFASWLVEAGVDLYTVKTLLGHQTLAMTERYSHLSQDTLRQAVDKFDQTIAGTMPEILSMSDQGA